MIGGVLTLGALVALITAVALLRRPSTLREPSAFSARVEAGVQRDTERRAFFARFVDHRQVFVVGASGIGKSWFVRESLVPQWREQGRRVLLLRDVLQPGTVERRLAVLGDVLRREGVHLPGDGADPPTGEQIEQALLALAGERPLVIILDQFDDYLARDELSLQQADGGLLTADELRAHDPFWDLIARLLTADDPDHRLTLVLVVREDAWHRAQCFRFVGDERFLSWVLAPLSRESCLPLLESLEASIHAPGRSWHELLEALMRDARMGEAGPEDMATELMAVRFFGALRGIVELERLTVDAYQRLGGLANLEGRALAVRVAEVADRNGVTFGTVAALLRVFVDRRLDKTRALELGELVEVLDGRSMSGAVERVLDELARADIVRRIEGGERTLWSLGHDHLCAAVTAVDRTGEARSWLSARQRWLRLRRRVLRRRLRISLAVGALLCLVGSAVAVWYAERSEYVERTEADRFVGQLTSPGGSQGTLRLADASLGVRLRVLRTVDGASLASHVVREVVHSVTRSDRAALAESLDQEWPRVLDESRPDGIDPHFMSALAAALGRWAPDGLVWDIVASSEGAGWDPGGRVRRSSIRLPGGPGSTLERLERRARRLGPEGAVRVREGLASAWVRGGRRVMRFMPLLDRVGSGASLARPGVVLATAARWLGEQAPPERVLGALLLRELAGVRGRDRPVDCSLVPDWGAVEKGLGLASTFGRYKPGSRAVAHRLRPCLSVRAIADVIAGELTRAEGGAIPFARSVLTGPRAVEVIEAFDGWPMGRDFSERRNVAGVRLAPAALDAFSALIPADVAADLLMANRDLLPSHREVTYGRDQFDYLRALAARVDPGRAPSVFEHLAGLAGGWSIGQRFGEAVIWPAFEVMAALPAPPDGAGPGALWSRLPPAVVDGLSQSLTAAPDRPDQFVRAVGIDAAVAVAAAAPTLEPLLAEAIQRSAGPDSAKISWRCRVAASLSPSAARAAVDAALASPRTEHDDLTTSQHRWAAVPGCYRSVLSPQDARWLVERRWLEGLASRRRAKMLGELIQLAAPALSIRRRLGLLRDVAVHRLCGTLIGSSRGPVGRAGPPIPRANALLGGPVQSDWGRRCVAGVLTEVVERKRASARMVNAIDALLAADSAERQRLLDRVVERVVLGAIPRRPVDFDTVLQVAARERSVPALVTRWNAPDWDYRTQLLMRHIGRLLGRTDDDPIEPWEVDRLWERGIRLMGRPPPAPRPRETCRAPDDEDRDGRVDEGCARRLVMQRTPAVVVHGLGDERAVGCGPSAWAVGLNLHGDAEIDGLELLCQPVTARAADLGEPIVVSAAGRAIAHRLGRRDPEPSVALRCDAPLDVLLGLELTWRSGPAGPRVADVSAVCQPVDEDGSDWRAAATAYRVSAAGRSAPGAIEVAGQAVSVTGTAEITNELWSGCPAPLVVGGLRAGLGGGLARMGVECMLPTFGEGIPGQTSVAPPPGEAGREASGG